jgi:hypothetical protein
MIRGIFHRGSGLGNQLHRYIATRVLAEDKGYGWGMVAPELFKGASFMNLNMGMENNFPYHIEEPAGKVVVDMPSPEVHLSLWEEKTNYYNPEFNFIEDFTIIDGEFQDERYFGDYLYEISEWLDTKWLNIPDNVCVIGFRGGEFSVFPDLFLPRDYWNTGIAKMREINPDMKFEVHTDDEELASQYFRNYPFAVIHDIGINWRSMRYAKHAIIANSSFYILPRLLSNGITIAPRYWARHNTQEWNMPQNYYKSFLYL